MHLSLCSTELAHRIQPPPLSKQLLIFLWNSVQWNTLWDEHYLSHLHRASKVWKSVSQDGIIPIFRTMISGRQTSFNTNAPEVSLKQPEDTLHRVLQKGVFFAGLMSATQGQTRIRERDAVIWSQAASSWQMEATEMMPDICHSASSYQRKRERARAAGGRKGGREGGQEGRKKGKKGKVLEYRQIRGTWKVMSGIDASYGMPPHQWRTFSRNIYMCCTW